MQVKGEKTSDQLPVRANTLNNQRVPGQSYGITQGDSEISHSQSGGPPIKKKVDSQARHLGYNSTTVGNTLKHSKTELGTAQVQVQPAPTGGSLNTHNSVVNPRKHTNRLPPYKTNMTEATDSCERLTSHNMSRGQDCGSSTNDIVLIDDMNSSCGTLKGGPLTEAQSQGKPSSIQTYRVNKGGAKREVLYSSFQQNTNQDKITVNNGKSRASMKSGVNLAGQIENGYQSNVPNERTKPGGGSFSTRPRPKPNMMTAFPKSRSGVRRDRGEKCDSSHDSFSCLEEDVINEDSSNSARSSAEDAKQISQSNTTTNTQKTSSKVTPYAQAPVEPLSDARINKGNRLRPLAPMSHKSTAGSSSIKSSYSGQYRGNRALNSKSGAPPSQSTKSTNDPQEPPYQQKAKGQQASVSASAQSQQSAQPSTGGRLRTTEAQLRMAGCTPLGTQNAVKNRLQPIDNSNVAQKKGTSSSMNTSAQLSNQIQRNGGSVGPNGRVQANSPGGQPPLPGVGESKPRQQQPKLLFEKGMFDRHKSGQFEMIFPFNKRTEELAFSLNRMSSSKAVSIGGPNYLKMIVEEIKQYETSFLAFVKNGRSYQQQPQYSVSQPIETISKVPNASNKSSVLN